MAEKSGAPKRRRSGRAPDRAAEGSPDIRAQSVPVQKFIFPQRRRDGKVHQRQVGIHPGLNLALARQAEASRGPASEQASVVRTLPPNPTSAI